MRPCLAASALAALAFALAARADSSPGSAYKELAAEFDDALAAYQKAYRAAKTDAERARVFRDRHPRVGDFASKFLALAKKHPDSAAAADALAWVVTHPLDPSAPEAKLRGQALELLARQHADSDRAGSLCTLLVHSIDPHSEAFLRAVRAKAKREPVRARAAASLAVNLRHRARIAEALGRSAEARKQYEAAFGKADVAALLEQKPKALRTESEKLFEEVASKHADFPHPTHGKLEAFARQNLLALRKPVGVDRVAPPLAGEDLDGKKLSLAAHKGEVVVLDFWSDAFPPCRAMYEYERGLVKRMAGKPFALVGVNGDVDRDGAKKAAAREKMTWRSFFDGGGTGGPIATRWDVAAWPTVVVIDHKGVVRHVYAGWPEAKKLDGVLDELVREAIRNP